MTAETTQLARETATLDPVTLEVLWNRLLSVANEQQAALMLVGLRDRLIRQRTQIANAIRGYAAEFGLVAAKGMCRIEPLLEGDAGHVLHDQVGGGAFLNRVNGHNVVVAYSRRGLGRAGAGVFEVEVCVGVGVGTVAEANTTSTQ